jgi:hypothetical protein
VLVPQYRLREPVERRRFTGVDPEETLDWVRLLVLAAEFDHVAVLPLLDDGLDTLGDRRGVVTGDVLRATHVAAAGPVDVRAEQHHRYVRGAFTHRQQTLRSGRSRQSGRDRQTIGLDGPLGRRLGVGLDDAVDPLQSLGDGRPRRPLRDDHHFDTLVLACRHTHHRRSVEGLSGVAVYQLSELLQQPVVERRGLLVGQLLDDQLRC